MIRLFNEIAPLVIERSFKVLPSTIEGAVRGVFTDRVIPKDTYIGPYTGKMYDSSYTKRPKYKSKYCALNNNDLIVDG